MDLPEFADAAETAQRAADAVRDGGRTLIPWLPDPPTCECGRLMHAGVTFDPREVRYVTSWECRHCDAPARYRDDPGVEDPDPPRRGATHLREVLNE